MHLQCILECPHRLSSNSKDVTIEQTIFANQLRASNKNSGCCTFKDALISFEDAVTDHIVDCQMTETMSSLLFVVRSFERVGFIQRQQ